MAGTARAMHELGTIDMFDHAGTERLVEARRTAAEFGALVLPPWWTSSSPPYATPASNSLWRGQRRLGASPQRATCSRAGAGQGAGNAGENVARPTRRGALHDDGCQPRETSNVRSFAWGDRGLALPANAPSLSSPRTSDSKCGSCRMPSPRLFGGLAGLAGLGW